MVMTTIGAAFFDAMLVPLLWMNSYQVRWVGWGSLQENIGTGHRVLLRFVQVCLEDVNWSHFEGTFVKWGLLDEEVCKRVWTKGMILAKYVLVCLHKETWSHFAGNPAEWGRLDGEDPQENVGMGHMVLVSWFLQVSTYQSW